MKLFSCKVFALTLTFTLGLLTIASGQAPAAPATSSDWETLRPEGEGFSVLIPKGSTFETSKEPYHKMELTMRTYLSSTAAGPVFAIVTLSGIKSNPALYTEMQRVNSYVDAFKILFTPKVRKDVVAKMALIGDKTLQGNAGREYRLAIGNLSGTVRVFATRKRFYSIVYLNTKKDDAVQDQFFSSFVLPEKISGASEGIAAEGTPANPSPSANASVAEGSPMKPSADENVGRQDEGDRVRNMANPVRAPISGGVLNGKALSLPAPEYPAAARQAKVSGTVAVQVVIDESGSVMSAHAASGHPLLQEAAVTAARQARFSPTLLMGEPVKITGVIVYNFGAPLN